ncbi:DUF255 domain-containing protein [Pelagicoccus sp. SDUM812002]|uniref:DUF255 domain-containing protein n=1 Tax=Pelagicoccus sp. SDUM812002 TaxID=3041266 RepID=UPI00280CB290|nr:DUF255 domain-containing protein [Pelagicoccus sp. SDUM812002]MDQ8187889.1 DUF255 domain-containing protein [Pelagicoccus sp. SDUM812002]
MSIYPRLPLLFLATFLSAELLAKSSFWTAHETDAVEWLHWNEETLRKAADTDKPLFFFVGHYGNSLARSMLGETFQNTTIASTLNETAIPVLVDINEEPELASLLGQMANEHFSANELPTCIWTDTHLAPLNGGGYFPPTDDWGGQGFLSVARNVSEQWLNNRADFVASAKNRLEESLTQSSISLSQLAAIPETYSAESFVDQEAPTLSALALYNSARYARTLPDSESKELAAELHKFIGQVVNGAGFDSIDGGFFIGSNDPNWKLPLFQKSTSDQAYMLLALSELYEIDQKSEYKFLIELTVAFIEQKLLKENGLAIQYLDSFAEGETPDMTEGSYYLIEGTQVAKLDSKAREAWGLSTEGNLDEDTDILGIYKGLNVPFAHSEQALSHELDKERKALRKLRSKKAFPLSDKNGYTATNALLARGLTAAAEALGDTDLTKLANSHLQRTIQANFDAVSGTLYNSDDRIQKASSHAYAQLAAAALSLKESNNESLDTAKAIYSAWQGDSRYLEDNALARKIGIQDMSSAIYLDGILESPVALHLENQLKLGEAQAPATSSLLESAPSELQYPSQFLESLQVVARLLVSQD